MRLYASFTAAVPTRTTRISPSLPKPCAKPCKRTRGYICISTGILNCPPSCPVLPDASTEFPFLTRHSISDSVPTMIWRWRRCCETPSTTPRATSNTRKPRCSAFRPSSLRRPNSRMPSPRAETASSPAHRKNGGIKSFCWRLVRHYGNTWGKKPGKTC